VLKGYVKRELRDKRLKQEILDILGRIFDEDMYRNGAPYVKEQTLNFCRVKKLDMALLKAHREAHSPNPNFDNVRRIVQNGLRVATDKRLTEYKKTFEDRVRAVNETVPRVPLGLHHIDVDVLRGGFPVKKYGVFLTFTGGGKTHYLVHIGASAMRAGKTVLHLSLEDDENDVSMRYDANFSGYPATVFLASKQIQEAVAKIIEQVPGHLFIKEYPGRTASVLTIRNHIEKLIEDGNKPDLVLVDYISEIKPTDKRERRHELAEISRDLRAVAVEYEVALWTAAQSQRYTMRKKVVKLEEIGEAYEIAHPADFFMTLGQSIRDEDEGVCKLYVAKNKTGVGGQLYVAEFQKHLSRFKIKDQLDASVFEAADAGYHVGE
jgi:replicative DNA helicase